MSKQNLEPTRIHYVLGTLGFIAFLALILIDAHPLYDVSQVFAGFLVVSYIVFLGFAGLVRYYFEVKYGG